MFYGSSCDESSGRNVANNPIFELYAEMTNPKSLNPRLTDGRVLSDLKDKRESQSCRVVTFTEMMKAVVFIRAREGRVKISSAA